MTCCTRLTLGGGDWEKEIAGQQLFVDELNLARANTTRTEIVVLCGTQSCIDYCEEKRIWAYGGYRRGRPEIVLLYTWIKLKGLIDTLVRAPIPTLISKMTDSGWALGFGEGYLFFRRRRLLSRRSVSAYEPRRLRPHHVREYSIVSFYCCTPQ